MKTIPLANGGEALVDDGDHERLSNFVWRRHSHGYAYRYVRVDGKQQAVLMHRVVLGLEDTKREVDHRNGNKADNRRENVRECTHAQNGQNIRRRLSGQHRFKGLDYVDKTPVRPWRAVIRVNGRRIRSHAFATDVEAALWYDAMALQHHGEFAVTNATLGLL